MVKITYDAERCKGCHYCVAACPKKCVTPTGEFNGKGYETVKFNEADWQEIKNYCVIKLEQNPIKKYSGKRKLLKRGG